VWADGKAASCSPQMTSAKGVPAEPAGAIWARQLTERGPWLKRAGERPERTELLVPEGTVLDRTNTRAVPSSTAKGNQTPGAGKGSDPLTHVFMNASISSTPLGPALLKRAGSQRTPSVDPTEPAEGREDHQGRDVQAEDSGSGGVRERGGRPRNRADHPPGGYGPGLPYSHITHHHTALDEALGLHSVGNISHHTTFAHHTEGTVLGTLARLSYAAPSHLRILEQEHCRG
jgi:hypothetical protein